MGFKSCYLVGAVNPTTGEKVGLIFSTVDTDVVNLFLKELGNEVPEGHHAILVLGGAGYHQSKGLKIPSNISLRHLPPYSPELNPIERLWAHIKENFLGNTVSEGMQQLFERGMAAWEKVTKEIVRSVCNVSWICA